MNSSVETLLAAVADISAVEWVGVALALGYLLLAIRQDPSCWACSIASSALYTVLFARAGLTMQSALQVFFIGMAVYGWWAWRGGAQHAPVAVQRWPASWHVLAVTAITIITFVNGAWLSHGTAAPERPLVPYVDAAIAWGSVFTTWLVARKVLENWLYWIVIDVAAAMLYLTQGLHATAGLYGLYAVLAVHGYRQWARDERRHADAVP